MKNGLTIRDAAERWVHEMNAIPQGMIEKLMNIGDGDIHEVTEPAVGDSVYFYADLKVKICDKAIELIDLLANMSLADDEFVDEIIDGIRYNEPYRIEAIRDEVQNG